MFTGVVLESISAFILQDLGSMAAAAASIACCMVDLAQPLIPKRSENVSAIS